MTVGPLSMQRPLGLTAAALASIALTACGGLPTQGGCTLALRQDGQELSAPYVARLTTREGEAEQRLVGFAGEGWTDLVTVAVDGGNAQDEYTMPGDAINSGVFEMRLQRADTYEVVVSDDAGCRAEFSILVVAGP